MTSSPQAPSTHPLLACADELDGALDRVADAPCWSATPAELRETLVRLERARARLDELRMRALAAADAVDVAADSAATSTGAWLAAATCRPAAAAAADVRLALALEQLPATRAALAAGEVDLDRARVVADAMAALPADVVAADASVPQRAESMLLELARVHDARSLKRLGRHVCHVLDPDAADRRLGVQLEREEQAAARRCLLELHDNGDGTHGGRLRIPTFHAVALARMLDAIGSPRRPDIPGKTGAGERAPDARSGSRAQRRGQALCDLVERFPADGLPVSGGVSATVVVLLDYDTLVTGLGTARLDTGERLSAGAARRLACEAGVIPAVVRRLVDGSSVVLDLGRSRRLHSQHQRIALAIEQGGCTAEHCDRPAGWCHAHHDTPWSRGGSTSVANGRLLCAYHHHRAHSAAYATQHLPDGTVRFHRRT